MLEEATLIPAFSRQVWREKEQLSVASPLRVTNRCPLGWPSPSSPDQPTVTTAYLTKTGLSACYSLAHEVGEGLG